MYFTYDYVRINIESFCFLIKINKVDARVIGSIARLIFVFLWHTEFNKLPGEVCDYVIRNDNEILHISLIRK